MSEKKESSQAMGQSRASFWASSLILMALILNTSTVNAAMPVSITSGDNYNCALTTAGGVKCWGINTYGQLGNGNTIASSTPVDVIGLTSGASFIKAGAYHACAILASNGSVKCWGRNHLGQLGNGTKDTANPVTTPVTVSNLTGAVSLAIGAYHTCAMLSTGSAKCWGDNANSKFGNGNTISSLIPVDVPGLSGVAGITAGHSHTCIWTTGQSGKCWGYNANGQLGTGDLASASTKTDVVNLSNVVSMSAGQYHTCALTTVGEVKCWGLNTNGQVGIVGGVNGNVVSPTTVTGLANGVVALAPMANIGNSSCAVLSNGEAKCWGLNNNKQLGLGTSDNASKFAPVSVAGLPGAVSSISIGTASACALVQAGVQCWGANGGQLGNGSTASIQIPVAVVGLFGSAPPTTPEPISPITSQTPTYVWKAIPGASDYRINVNGSIASYSAAQSGCEGGVGLCRIVGMPLTAGVYTWYVQGYNSYGNGPWSSGTNFGL
ncbi:RCC1 domain-containing protein [Aquabacterium sp.]|uniref:RCC1 domain-containing protein n=1 Tax=Aquabacterium sp. TaxID=1872578 RepID=UPI003D6C9AE2